MSVRARTEGLSHGTGRTPSLPRPPSQALPATTSMRCVARDPQTGHAPVAPFLPRGMVTPVFPSLDLVKRPPARVIGVAVDVPRMRAEVREGPAITRLRAGVEPRGVLRDRA